MTRHRTIAAVLATATASVTVAGALVLAAASPAQATAQQCITYQQTTARNAICEETEALADNTSQQIAFIQCHNAMEATLLPHDQADTTCELAIQD